MGLNTVRRIVQAGYSRRPVHSIHAPVSRCPVSIGSSSRPIIIQRLCLSRCDTRQYKRTTENKQHSFLHMFHPISPPFLPGNGRDGPFRSLFPLRSECAKALARIQGNPVPASSRTKRSGTEEPVPRRKPKLKMLQDAGRIILAPHRRPPRSFLLCLRIGDPALHGRVSPQNFFILRQLYHTIQLYC